MQAEVKDAYWAIFDTEDLKTPPGPRLVEIIDARISELAARYRATYPAAMKCLLTDREGLTAYLRFPAEHHHRIRHSNFIERTFGETRRRVKVIGRLPGETSCLTLVWAVLDRASRGWRGLTMTSDGLRLLQDLRRRCSSRRCRCAAAARLGRTSCRERPQPWREPRVRQSRLGRAVTRPAPAGYRWCQRNWRKNSRTSPVSRSGASRAAKWPRR